MVRVSTPPRSTLSLGSGSGARSEGTRPVGSRRDDDRLDERGARARDGRRFGRQRTGRSKRDLQADDAIGLERLGLFVEIVAVFLDSHDALSGLDVDGIGAEGRTTGHLAVDGDLCTGDVDLENELADLGFGFGERFLADSRSAGVPKVVSRMKVERWRAASR